MNRKIFILAAAFFLVAFSFCAWSAARAGEGADRAAVAAPAAGGQASDGGSSSQLSGADRQAAVAAAEAWLRLIDEAKYEESYKEASAFFRNSVSEAEWIRAIATFRAPHGKAVSRKKISTSTSPDEPGLPEGEYVVVKYETNFEKKADCTEDVMCTKDPEGKWRVVGYHLTQAAAEAEAAPSAPAQ